jgi:hypothetical protein
MMSVMIVGEQGAGCGGTLKATIIEQAIRCHLYTEQRLRAVQVTL